MDELREVLGQWAWAENSFSVDTVWYELDWFLQPTDGPEDMLLYPTRPKVGDPAQTPLDHALKGSHISPVDDSNCPIIHTCGSKDADCFGYNPPDAIAEINDALSVVADQSWEDLVPQRTDLYTRTLPEHADSFPDIVAKELEFARVGLEVVRNAYATALDRRYGVACEYSL